MLLEGEHWKDIGNWSEMYEGEQESVRRELQGGTSHQQGQMLPNAQVTWELGNVHLVTWRSLLILLWAILVNL